MSVCVIAFLTDDSFLKHQREKDKHTKPIDLNNIRRSLHQRSSMEYWQTTKKKAAKKFNDEGEEVEEEAMDEDVGDGNNDGLEEKGDEEDNDDDEEASAPVVSKPGRRQGPGRRVKGRFR